MCMLLSDTRKECILETIKENSGECKLLHEWFCLINRDLPKSQQMNLRSLSHILTAMEKKGYFICKKRKVGPTTYFTCIYKGSFKS